jgi:hypothetical protein
MSTNPYELACDAFANQLIKKYKISLRDIEAVINRNGYMPLRESIREFIRLMDPGSCGVVAYTGRPTDSPFGMSLKTALQKDLVYEDGGGPEQLRRLAYGALVARVHEHLSRARAERQQRRERK